ncbi:hypothetical protein WA016_04432 [Myxococcus stipitatus]
MLYGDSKSREMARSLLPSTYREVARKDKAFAKRSARRASRVRISQLSRAPELAEDCAELEEDSSVEMKGVVSGRRHADKVHPFIRWAEQKTQGQPRETRLDLMRATLPPGVIGHHALSHLRRVEHFMTAAELASRDAWRARWRNPRLNERGLLAQLLRTLLLLPDGQKTFNTYLKRACAQEWSLEQGRDGREHVVLHGPEKLRLLLGTHDVLAFLDDLAVHPLPSGSRPSVGDYASTRFAALDFLRLFHRLGGDLVATRAALPVRTLENLPRLVKRGGRKHAKAIPGESS